jgi:hypothetical protein
VAVGRWALRPELVPPAGTPPSAPRPSERAREARPSAVEPGIAPQSTPNDTPEGLRSLGYISGGTESKSESLPPSVATHRKTSDSPPAGPPLPTGVRPAPLAESSPAEPSTPSQPVGATQDKLAAAPAGASRSYAGKNVAAEAPPGAPRSGRSLVVDRPDRRLSVSEDGTVVLSADRYACTVRLDTPSVDPEITALFTLASSGGPEAPGATDAEPRSAPAVRLFGGETDPGRSGKDSRSLPAWKAIEIENRLAALLRDRYLSLMESRCGPVPRSIRNP